MIIICDDGDLIREDYWDISDNCNVGDGDDDGL